MHPTQKDCSIRVARSGIGYTIYMVLKTATFHVASSTRPPPSGPRVHSLPISPRISRYGCIPPQNILAKPRPAINANLPAPLIKNSAVAPSRSATNCIQSGSCPDHANSHLLLHKTRQTSMTAVSRSPPPTLFSSSRKQRGWGTSSGMPWCTKSAENEGKCPIKGGIVEGLGAAGGPTPARPTPGQSDLANQQADSKCLLGCEDGFAAPKQATKNDRGDNHRRQGVVKNRRQDDQDQRRPKHEQDLGGQSVPRPILAALLLRPFEVDEGGKNEARQGCSHAAGEIQDVAKGLALCRAVKRSAKWMGIGVLDKDTYELRRSYIREVVPPTFLVASKVREECVDTGRER